LADLLWSNSGITITSTSSQTVNSVAWPARDINGSTDGEGVYVALELRTTSGAGAPSFSMSYTNSAGTSGRTGTGVMGAAGTTAGAGAWYVIGLQAGDTGVRSIQSITLSATWTSGSAGLVAFRPLFFGTLDPVLSNGRSSAHDAISMAMPKLHPETFLSICRGGMNSASAQGVVRGNITFSVG
jgi:hypothetical protein